MSKPQPKRKKSRRQRTKRRPPRRERDLERLFELAAEDVPIGSGTTEYGRGRYVYLKGSWHGSERVFRFVRHSDALRAKQIGMASDRRNADIETDQVLAWCRDMLAAHEQCEAPDEIDPLAA